MVYYIHTCKKWIKIWCLPVTSHDHIISLFLTSLVGAQSMVFVFIPFLSVLKWQILFFPCKHLSHFPFLTKRASITWLCLVAIALKSVLVRYDYRNMSHMWVVKSLKSFTLSNQSLIHLSLVWLKHFHIFTFKSPVVISQVMMIVKHLQKSEFQNSCCYLSMTF